MLDPPPPIWLSGKRLDDLLRQDPRRAKIEILKHLDGDLVRMPRPSSPMVAGAFTTEIDSASFRCECRLLAEPVSSGSARFPPAPSDGTQLGLNARTTWECRNRTGSPWPMRDSIHETVEVKRAA